MAVVGAKKDIGSRIKQARAALGLTQKDLCNKTGLPLPSLRNYELSHRIPGGDAIGLLVDVGINSNWLLREEGPMLLADSAKPTGLDMERLRLSIETVEEGLAATRSAMEPGKKAELVLAVYDLLDEAGANKERVLKLVKLAA